MIGDLGNLLSGGKQRDDRIYGVVVGVVTNNQDPDNLGRVKIKFPWLSDENESDWARIAVLMAGPERGTYFIPEVEDEVLVSFEHGRLDAPIVIGSLWNGTEKPPGKNDDGKNNLRFIKSRCGHTITLDDTDGAEKITIADKEAKNTIVIDSKENSITVTSEKDLTLKAKGKITIESDDDLSVKCKNLKLESQQSLSIKAGKDGKVEAQSGLGLSCSAGVSINDGAMEVK